MANPLSPLSNTRANTQYIHSTIEQSYETSSYQTTLQEDTFYDVEEYVPSSPFMAEPDYLQDTPYGRSKSQSPRKMNAQQGSPTKSFTKFQSTRLVPHSHSAAIEDKENQPDGGISSLGSSRIFDPDDTCASAFSMVPTTDMTRFAKLHEPSLKGSPSRRLDHSEHLTTPSKCNGNDTITPYSCIRTPGAAQGTARQFSPTPRCQRSDEATTELLEFTERLAVPSLRYSPKKTTATSASQARDAGNLLDFDLPPAPTPRSIPSISVREVESMKANFQSEISSLNATINGKEATIQSLVETKNNAERRVGELSESLRDVSDTKKMLLEEKEEWEKRDSEVRTILRDVKSELVHRERECDDLSARLEESERIREEVETRLQAAEAKIADHESHLQQDLAVQNASPPGSKTPNKAIEIAVEKVARELHQLYKQKHETKVTALKKSYEGRWEKKVRDLECRITDLTKENDDLRNGREATMTKVMPSTVLKSETVDAATSPRCNSIPSSDFDTSAPATHDLESPSAESSAKIEALNMKLAALEEQIQQSKEDSQRLMAELNTSRAENSDLVAVVEEMLQMDANASIVSAAGIETPMSNEIQAPNEPLHHTRGNSQMDNELAVANYPPSRTDQIAPKASGLARPGFGFGGAGRGIGRPTSGGARSGIMSSIEKMGRGRAGESQ